jgi:hypothetical protein
LSDDLGLGDLAGLWGEFRLKLCKICGESCGYLGEVMEGGKQVCVMCETHGN